MMEPTQDKPHTEELVSGVEPLEPRSVRTSPSRQRIRRRTGSGDRVVDEKIRALLADIEVADCDLLQDVLETAFRMARTANRGEMKLISRSLRELGRAFRVFAPYRGVRKVSIFGSARTRQEDGEYALARDFSMAPDMSLSEVYPPGPYGSNVGDTIAPLVREGYLNPTAQGIASKAPYGPLAMNDLRKSGKRIAALYAADFF